MSKMICPNCGSENSEFDLVCEVCDASLPEDSRISFDGASPTIGLTAAAIRERSLRAGNRVDHFEIIGKQGEGGMGTVYKARDLQLNRFVALKVFNTRWETGGISDHFLEEARMISHLNHPNIVAVYDVARTDNLQYIAMEWVEGETLEKVIPADGLPIAQAMNYARQIAYGLAAAHAQGIVHRDIKPGNVMLTHDDTIKILDFGVAYNIQRNVKRVETPEKIPIVGTIPYMSPEQICGKQVDQRSDIFSFGILLYLMLTGDRPFKGQGLPELSRQILEADPKPLSFFRSDIPKPVDELVMKCLERRHTDRFQSMGALIQNLPRRQEDFRNLDVFTGEERRRGRDRRSRKNNILAASLIAIPILLLALVLFLRTQQGPVEAEPVQDWLIGVDLHCPDRAKNDIDWLCRGLAVTIGQDLNRWSTESQRFRVSPVELTGLDAQLANRKYGINLIVSGSVAFRDNRYFLDLRASRAGGPTRSISIQAEMENLKALNDSLLEQVPDLLGLEGTVLLRSAFSVRTMDNKAWSDYLMGLGKQKLAPEQAVDLFRRALIQDPNFLEAVLAFGELSRSTSIKSRSLQIEALDHLLRLDTLEYPQRETEKGLIYLELNQPARAEKALIAALGWEPDEERALAGLATLLEARADWDLAERTWARLGRNPKLNPQGLGLYGAYLLRRGQYGRAMAIFRNLISLCPASSQGYCGLSHCLFLTGKLKEALSVCQTIPDDAHSADILRTLGEILIADGQFETALSTFTKLIDEFGPEGSTQLGWLRAAALGSFSGPPPWTTDLPQSDQPEPGPIGTVRSESQTTGILTAILRNGQHFELDQLRRINFPRDSFNLATLIMIHEKLGNRDQSLELLKAARVLGVGTEGLNYYPELGELRSNEAFLAIFAQK